MTGDKTVQEKGGGRRYPAGGLVGSIFLGYEVEPGLVVENWGVVTLCDNP